MAFPSKNSSTYTAPSKSSSSSTFPAQAGQNFLLIDSTYLLLIDAVDKLLIEPLNQDWSYASKS